MNIGFLITPKNDVVWVYNDISMRQAMEKMEYHRYAAIPIISRSGKYVGTLTEGDLLWQLKKMMKGTLRDTGAVRLSSVQRNRDNLPVPISCTIEEASYLSMKQSFVPVVDDEGVFIGMVLRSTLIKHYLKKKSEESK